MARVAGNPASKTGSDVITPAYIDGEEDRVGMS